MVPLLLGLAIVAQAQDLVLPSYRPVAVRQVRDTVWWTAHPPERSGPVPVAGYVPATGRFVAQVRARRSLRESGETLRWSGTPEYSYDAERDSLLLPYGYGISEARSSMDSAPRRSLTLRGRPANVLGLRASVAERRRLYRAAGKRLGAQDMTPPFHPEVARWAAGNGVLVFAFDSPALHEEDEQSLRRDGKPTDQPGYLGGLLLLDTLTRRTTAFIRPELVTQTFLGLEIAAGAVWATVADYYRGEGDTLNDYALLRYDLAKRTWRRLPPSAIPLRDAVLHHSDGRRLYFASHTGIAVLDATTERWDVRHLRDSAWVRADGLDTVVTILSADLKPSHRVAEADDDTTRILGAVADELEVRAHRTAFVRALRAARLPLDTLELATQYRNSNRYYCDDSCPFVGARDDVPIDSLLARPEFTPFLIEALERNGTFSYALTLLTRIDSAVALEGLRGTLRTGEIAAVFSAADELTRRGDTSAIPWLRSRLTDPEWLELDSEEGQFYGQTLIDQAVRYLSAVGDTAFVPVTLAALASGAVKQRLGTNSMIVHSLVMHPEPRTRVRVGEYFAARPHLWPLFKGITDSLARAQGIGNVFDTIAVRLIRSSRALTDSIAASRPPGSYWATRDALVSSAINRTSALPPRVVIPLLIETFERDPDLAHLKHVRLIQLLGDDAAPLYPYGKGLDTIMRAAADYWRTTWGRNAATFTPVSEAEGLAAYQRWLRRYRP